MIFQKPEHKKDPMRQNNVESCLSPDNYHVSLSLDVRIVGLKDEHR